MVTTTNKQVLTYQPYSLQQEHAQVVQQDRPPSKVAVVVAVVVALHIITATELTILLVPVVAVVEQEAVVEALGVMIIMDLQGRVVQAVALHQVVVEVMAHPLLTVVEVMEEMEAT
jgi:hypothetical protein